jgi:hypothetical protein
LEVVRLYTEILKPWSATLRAKFWPMTARPIRPISDVASDIIIYGFKIGRKFTRRAEARLESDLLLNNDHLWHETNRNSHSTEIRRVTKIVK